MKKLALISAATLLSTTIGSVGFAQGNALSSDAAASLYGSNSSNVDLACVSAALEVKTKADAEARAAFSVALKAAMDVRADALVKAYAISNADDRRAAIIAAWRAYFSAVIDARVKYKATVKAAADVYVKAKVECRKDDPSSSSSSSSVSSSVSSSSSSKDRKDDKDKDRSNRGLHLGWFKNGKINDDDNKGRGNASVKGDLKVNDDAKADLKSDLFLKFGF